GGYRGLVLHGQLAPRGSVTAKTRVTEVIDKGPGKGALVYSKRVVVDKATGERIATATQTTFCRGDGGFGGPPREAPPVHAIPERAPHHVLDLPTPPGTAPIYRPRGAPNPPHVDPPGA